MSCISSTRVNTRVYYLKWLPKPDRKYNRNCEYLINKCYFTSSMIPNSRSSEIILFFMRIKRYSMIMYALFN